MNATRATTALAVTIALSGCEPRLVDDLGDPARGPGGLVGNGPPISNGMFAGSGVIDPAPADLAGALPPDAPIPACGPACQAHCASLALENPVDAAACPVLWGVGLDTRPVVAEEACRRLFVDLTGRFPSRDEAREVCGGRPWGEVVRQLMGGEAFIELNQRRWADRLLYNNGTVSFQRIYDMDRLVGKLYRGLVAYDQFAVVLSAHPVLTRRHATPGDRAEALFQLLLGRPPFENERADLGRLYVLWDNDYYDHPGLGLRLPDAFIKFRCLTSEGAVDPAEKGECTSTQWGFHELILTPDIRARNGEMWSGLLRPEEWQKLQAPGQVLARGMVGMWEHLVDEVLREHLGYDLGASVPAARERMIEYVLRYNGDIRAAHHAVLTSQLYLQSSAGTSATAHRWTYGPQRQVEAETWIDTIEARTGYQLSSCDHRLPEPDLLLRPGSVAAFGVVERSRWELDERRGVKPDYRDLARTLGGCPDNGSSGRFKTISILTTAAQEGFVRKVCNPGLRPDEGAAIAKLLPPGVEPRRPLDPPLGMEIMDHQVGLFFGRDLTGEEREEAGRAAEACSPKPCTAEAFARPICFAVLSSAEMLFY